MLRWHSRKLGQHYEQQALEYLQSQGLIFIERNFHSRFGEIDLICQHHNTLVFIEVKYRKSNRYGSALESVTPTKLKKLYKTALYWLQKNRYSATNSSLRFDLVAIEGNPSKITWLQNIMIEG
ncbi:YraN family protein [Vibrio sp. SS-MA-C1-2]|uniref:YraN family protein n=1 Tax=Vibrio sp. SS-MA-C1-2 TaxID=2908646 RepID=UPI001F1F8117|nr:YraN family protein [Vibrio sp. SS-MA-C1-2]UJF19081.1 YraN family protein [Vibrio sp. SS-MA-C1-2]